MAKSSSYINWITRLVISGIATALVFYSVELEELSRNLSALNHNGFLIILPATVMTWLLKSWRLKTMLSEKPWDVSAVACFQGMAVGLFANIFLPFRGGDILRCYVLGRLLPMTGFSGQLGVMMLEKIIELISMVLIVIFWVWVAGVGAAPRELALAGVVICLLCYVLFKSVKIVEKALARLSAERLPLSKIVSRVHSFLKNFIEGLYILGRRGNLAEIVFQTGCLRVMQAVLFYGFAVTLGLEISALEAFVLTAFVGFATSIPALPGFIGTFEFVVAAGLAFFGVERADAVSFAVLGHGWLLLTWVFIGLAGILTLPVDIRRHLRRPDLQETT